MSDIESEQEKEQVEPEASDEKAQSEVPAESGQAEGIDQADVASQSAEDPVGEDAPVTEPDMPQLDKQLGDDSGVEEALETWNEGGHDLDEFDDKEEIASVRFPQLEPAVPKVQDRSDLLNNVWVDVVVELGRKDMMVSEVANLKIQEVIEIDKLAGEAFEVRVNGRIYARGEVVVVADQMAVRITSLVTNPDTEKAKKED